THLASLLPGLPVLYLAPFLFLAVLFGATDWLAMRHVSQLRAAAENLEQDMLADNELGSQMRHDLDGIQLLVDQHVLESDTGAMASLEVKIAETRADYAAAAAKYEAMPMLPGERAPWEALKGVVTDIDPRLDRVLALSRVNDDEAAYRNLAELEGA